jgi:hypothetical protein
LNWHSTVFSSTSTHSMKNLCVRNRVEVVRRRRREDHAHARVRPQAMMTMAWRART